LCAEENLTQHHLVTRFVPRETIDAHGPGIYESIPAEFRDRIPFTTASERNTDLIRKGFNLFSGAVDRIFARLKYEEGRPWEQWKLVAAFYLIERHVGATTATRIGSNVFETMPWPPNVRSIEDAIHGIEPAFRAAHEAPLELIGGWPVVEASPGMIVLENSTMYPCSLEEGTISGICASFREQHPSYKIRMRPPPKREGGAATFYEVSFRPRR
jgi:hypothetical protein